MILNNEIKKRFCKDFNLPINIFDEEIFNYYIDLYDEKFKTKEKLKMLDEVLKEVNYDQDKFFDYGLKLLEKLKNEIKNTKSFEEFNSCDFNQFKINKKISSEQNIYINENVGIPLISIDLKKANFNSFRVFGLQKELNIESYEDLIGKFTNLEYYKKSKFFRQVLFGDLNPSRQQTVQKYIINKITDELLKYNYTIVSSNSDEIILKNVKDINKVEEILDNIDKKYHFFKIESFVIDKIFNEKPYFVKRDTMTNEITLKNVPSYLYSQAYKKYFDLPINKNDLLFYHEGFLCEFKETLLDNDEKHNKKIKNKIK